MPDRVPPDVPFPRVGVRDDETCLICACAAYFAVRVPAPSEYSQAFTFGPQGRIEPTHEVALPFCTEEHWQLWRRGYRDPEMVMYCVSDIMDRLLL